MRMLAACMAAAAFNLLLATGEGWAENEQKPIKAKVEGQASVKVVDPADAKRESGEPSKAKQEKAPK